MPITAEHSFFSMSRQATWRLIYDASGTCIDEGDTALNSEFRHSLAQTGNHAALFLPDSLVPEETLSKVRALKSGEAVNFTLVLPEQHLAQGKIRAFGEKEVASHYLLELEWTSQIDAWDASTRLELVKLSRMAQVGGLGGPIAHALNNPLATIRGFAEVMKRRFAQIEKVAYFSDKIITNADRMSETIDLLRRLSKDEFGRDPKEMSLAEALRSSIEIMEEQFRMREIHLETQIPEDLPTLYGQPGLWQAVMLSLLASSRDTFSRQTDLENPKKVIVTVSATPSAVTLEYLDTAGSLPTDLDRPSQSPMEILATAQGIGDFLPLIVNEICRQHQAQIDVKVKKNDTSELKITCQTSRNKSSLPGDMESRQAG